MEIQSRRKNKKLGNAAISAILVGVFVGTSLTAGTATALWSDNTEVQGVNISNGVFLAGEIKSQGTDGSIAGEVSITPEDMDEKSFMGYYGEIGKAYKAKLNPVKGIDVQKTGEASWDISFSPGIRNGNTMLFDFEKEWAEIKDGTVKVYAGKCSDNSDVVIGGSYTNSVVHKVSNDEKTRIKVPVNFEWASEPINGKTVNVCIKAKLPESSAKNYGVIGASDDNTMTTFVGDNTGSTYKNNVKVSAKDPNTGKTTSGKDSWETKILRFPNPTDVKAYVVKRRIFTSRGICYGSYAPPETPFPVFEAEPR